MNTSTEDLAWTHTPWGQWQARQLVDQKAPFKLKEIWAIRVRLRLEHRLRDWRCSIWVSTVAARLRPGAAELPSAPFTY